MKKILIGFLLFLNVILYSQIEPFLSSSSSSSSSSFLCDSILRVRIYINLFDNDVIDSILYLRNDFNSPLFMSKNAHNIDFNFSHSLKNTFITGYGVIDDGNILSVQIIFHKYDNFNFRGTMTSFFDGDDSVSRLRKYCNYIDLQIHL